MKATRLAVLMLLFSGVWSCAFASAQSEWESTWYSLLAGFQQAPNDVIREDIVTRLEGYGSEVPQHLSGWVGTLRVFRYSPDRSMVGGSITLQDADHTSLHGILFYCPASALGPAGVADPFKLREGVLVEVSGVLESAGFWGESPNKSAVQSATTFEEAGVRDAPRRPGPLMVKKLSGSLQALSDFGFAWRDFLDGLSERTVVAMEGGVDHGSTPGVAQAAPPKPWVNPADEIVKYAPRFLDRIPRGVIITVRLEKLVPFEAEPKRGTDLARLRNAGLEIDGIRDQLLDLIPSTDGGHGLPDEVWAEMSCEALRLAAESGACADAFRRAQQLEISCDHGFDDAASAYATQSPTWTGRAFKERNAALVVLADSLSRLMTQSRFEAEYTPTLEQYERATRQLVSDVRAAHENYSYLKTCLAAAQTSGSIPAVQPPKGLRWGMTYQEVREYLTPEGLDIDKPKRRDEAQDVVLPDTCTVTKAKGMLLQYQKADEGWLVFDRRGGLCGVLLRYDFRCESKKLGSTCSSVASAFLGELASSLAQRCTGESNGGLTTNAPGKRDDSEAVCYDAASGSGMKVHAAWTALTSSNYLSRRPAGTAAHHEQDCICCVVRIQYARGDWTRLDPRAQGM